MYNSKMTTRHDEKPLETETLRLSLAQAAFRKFWIQCFWFMPKNLVVKDADLSTIVAGLKLHGGHLGRSLADQLQKP